MSEPAFDLLPLLAARKVAAVLASGDAKHGRETRLEGPSRRHWDGAIRHLDRFMAGELVDADSGEHPIDHAIARLMLLREAELQFNAEAEELAPARLPRCECHRPWIAMSNGPSQVCGACGGLLS